MSKVDIQRKSWVEFRDAGLLWWINRSLQLFGWCIVFEFDSNAGFKDVYPARVPYRGFITEVEESNFARLTRYIKNNIDQLLEESNEKDKA